MKKSLVLICTLMLPLVLVAQEFEASISEAKSAYNSKNLEDTRFALQQALSAVDVAIGKQILSLLPSELGGMAINAEDDTYSGNTMGFSGIYVDRSYGDQEKSASINMVTDSPLMSAISAILSMPMMMNLAGDKNQKVIKIDGYKSVLQKQLDSEEKVTGYEVQIPLRNTLMTVDFDGFDDENTVIGMINQIPVEKIAQTIE